MKALSLWQPHAIAIGLGLKLYETRGWQLRPEDIGVPVAIHASKKEFREQDYSWNYFREVRDRLRAAGCSLASLDYGKVVCICTFMHCSRTREVREQAVADAEQSMPPWYFWGDFTDQGEDGRERFAFKIAEVRLIPPEHRPAITGRQGFFNVPDEIGLWE
jgi:hypothetical protein